MTTGLRSTRNARLDDARADAQRADIGSGGRIAFVDGHAKMVDAVRCVLAGAFAEDSVFPLPLS